MKFSLFVLVVLLIGTNADPETIKMYTDGEGGAAPSTPFSYTVASSCTGNIGTDNYISFYYNLEVPQIPAVVTNAVLNLGVLGSNDRTKAFVKAAIARAVPENFKAENRASRPIFNPDESSTPILMTEFVDASITSNKATFDFSTQSTPIVFDRHTFLYVLIEKCGYTIKRNTNDTKFVYIIDGSGANADIYERGCGIDGTYTVTTRSLRTAELAAAGMKEGYTRVDYYDDVCTCDFGVPDLACQNPEIGPANAEGCVGNELCVLDVCVAGVKGGKDINCPYHYQHFGNDGVCECGCLGESGLPDIDCFYPNRYFLKGAGDDYTVTVGQVHGVTGFCDTDFPVIVNESWTCAVEKYNDTKTCECFCGYLDPDCENKTLPTDCHDDFVCALTDTANLSSQECLAPKAWTCDPNMYNMTGPYASRVTTCYCNCSVDSPACHKKISMTMHCDDGQSHSIGTSNDEFACLPNGTCAYSPCGSGLYPFGNRECDGGIGCDSDCRCNSRDQFKPNIPHTVSCHKSCGDGFFDPNYEECDQSMFCDNSTCRCLPGHELENDTEDSSKKHCAGCGNAIRDEGEECDGGEGCLSNCVCDEISGFSPSDNKKSTGCVKTSQTLPIIVGGAIGAVVLIVSIVILFIIVNHYKTDEQKATRKVRQSENAIKSAKSANSKITFDSKSALNPQPRMAGPDPSLISQLNVSTQGGGMALDDEDE